MTGSGHCARCKNPFIGCANEWCSCHPDFLTAAEIVALREAEGAA